MGLRLCGQTEEAEDLVQETFLKAWRSAKESSPCLDHPKAWLMRILINLSRDHYRRQKARPLTQEFELEPKDASHEEASLARQTLTKALAQMEPRRKAILILHDLEEHDAATVAQLLGIQKVTVRWHLSRARKSLRAWLEKEPH